MNIDRNTPHQEIENLLHSINFLNKEEQIESVEIPGAGNMNVVIRVLTNQRSFIVKQSRPFVQKYQDIPAPVERIEVEHEFYKAVTNDAISTHIPRVLAFAKAEHLLILEDLGDCKDMSYLYTEREISDAQLAALVKIIATIHATVVPEDYPQNLGLRELNHQHIFLLPLDKNHGFPLDKVQPGLEQLSQKYRNDKALKAEVKKVGERYLSAGTTLLHGDYYPGSWMTREDHIYVLDPEISFLGFAEFDLGVLAAHAILITGKSHATQRILEWYPKKVDVQLLSQFTGIEILRRLIGLAQLPLERSIEEKERLLELGYELVMN
jgi:5-methylthioribose kinase